MVTKDPFSPHRPTTRVLDILELLASNTDGFTLSEIADKISAAKGTLFPVLRTLCFRKFVLHEKTTGKYTIGISAFCVGESYTNNRNTIQFFHEEMLSIVNQVGEICQLGILDNSDALYLAKVDNKEAIRLVSHVGKRLPAYCTALGKALLSEHSLDELRALYPYGLRVRTSQTITSFIKLEKELQEIRRTQIASEYEECSKYLTCLATPLRSEGKIIAALSVSTPTFRLDKNKTELTKLVLLYEKEKIETYLNAEQFNSSDFIF